MRQPSYDPASKFRVLSNTLKRLGYAKKKEIKLYGQAFQLVNDPVVMTDTLVFVDAVETKSGRELRLRIPMNIVNMAQAQIAA
jgi:hypothetical protein